MAKTVPISPELNAWLDSAINDLVKDMETQVNDKTDEISSLLDTGDPADEEKVHQLLHEQYASNLQIASLKDLLSTKTGDKVFLDKEGNPTSSQKDAMYVVNSDKKVVVKDNKCYLLKAGQELRLGYYTSNGLVIQVPK